MKLRIFQVDAFTSRTFAGNPAAVVPLESWLPDATMLAIAAENNLAETAFLVRAPGEGADCAIRWFTPEVEIDLCGHATLASAYVLRRWLGWKGDALRFSSKSGILGARFLGAGAGGAMPPIQLDFPSRPPVQAAAPAGLAAALGAEPVEVLKSRDWLVLLRSEGELAQLAPDFRALKAVPAEVGIIVTAAAAPGAAHDFSSRFFAPAAGIPEDPVTGSSHSTLAPYWAARLGKARMEARQLSRRGGELGVELAGDRVLISGRCAEYLEGWIEV